MSKRHRRRRDVKEEAKSGEGLWVQSDVMPDGTYAVTVSADADHVWVLDRPAAFEYARTGVEAAQRAEYDAALFRLLTEKMSLAKADAAAVIGNDLRPDRPPLNDAATAPLTYLPGATGEGKPFIHIHLNGEPWGQVSPRQLREHAMTVLEAPAAADLDAGLMRFLKTINIDQNRAEQLIGDLANWRESS